MLFLSLQEMIVNAKEPIRINGNALLNDFIEQIIYGLEPNDLFQDKDSKCLPILKTSDQIILFLSI